MKHFLGAWAHHFGSPFTGRVGWCGGDKCQCAVCGNTATAPLAQRRKLSETNEKTWGSDSRQ